MLNRDASTWPPFPGPDAPLAVRLRWSVERFLAPGPAPGRPAVPSAPGSDHAELAAGLSAASLADWAARGEIVTLFSRTLAGSVYLAPTPEAVRELVEAGVPRHRVYLPGELAGLRELFSLASPQRTKAIRVLDALRDVFDGEVEGVTCSVCHRVDWWRSTAGQMVCRRCHPPAPGAEASR